MAEDRQREREKLQRQFEELCVRAGRGAQVSSKFLSPDAAQRLCGLAARQGLLCFRYGGGENAERSLCVLCPEDFGGADESSVPICVLKVRFDPRFGSFGHRDLLGAILGLQIERDCVGDLRILEGKAYAAVYKPMAAFLCDNLREVGRVSVRTELTDEPLPPPPEGKKERVNVPSLRLDACLQQVLRLSRAKAQELVRAGRVQRNWEEETRTDASLEAGDMVSVRGVGRFRILEKMGESRKNRLFIEVETFLSKS